MKKTNTSKSKMAGKDSPHSWCIWECCHCSVCSNPFHDGECKKDLSWAWTVLNELIYNYAPVWFGKWWFEVKSKF